MLNKKTVEWGQSLVYLYARQAEMQYKQYLKPFALKITFLPSLKYKEYLPFKITINPERVKPGFEPASTPVRIFNHIISKPDVLPISHDYITNTVSLEAKVRVAQYI